MARRPALDRGPQASGEYQFVRNGEVRIAYQGLGEGGPPVLFLQPFWLSCEDVRVPGDTFGPLLVDSYRTIVHDRRGTGASDRHPGLVDTRVQAQDLAAVLDAADVNRVLVVAMTEAAPLAVHFAAEYPDRIARVVLIDPQLRPRIGQGSTMLLHTLHSRPRVGLRAFARSLAEDDEAADALAERMANRLDAPTAARLFEAFLNAGALDVVPAVAARTLLAFGVYEKMVIEEEALDLQAQFADAQLGLVQGMPGTPAAAREAWIELRDFLAAAPRSGPDEPLNQRRPSVVPVAMPRRNAGVLDYVPAAPDMQRIPVSATLSPEALGPSAPAAAAGPRPRSATSRCPKRRSRSTARRST